MIVIVDVYQTFLPIIKPCFGEDFINIARHWHFSLDSNSTVKKKQQWHRSLAHNVSKDNGDTMKQKKCAAVCQMFVYGSFRLVQQQVNNSTDYHYPE